MYEAVDCDNSRLVLECPNKNDSILIVSALYGRKDTKICGFEEHFQTECSHPDAYSNIYSLCNGRMSCEITPYAKLFGDDPCNGTHKYLQVKFMCTRKCIFIVLD